MLVLVLVLVVEVVLVLALLLLLLLLLLVLLRVLLLCALIQRHPDAQGRLDETQMYRQEDSHRGFDPLEDAQARIAQGSLLIILFNS